jgi:ABC-type branched-subunit amino acid transport system permease subunit
MISVMSLAFYFVGMYLFTSEAIASDFDDLGKLMLGGFLAAVAVALLFTFVRLRLRGKRAHDDGFISISSQDRD